jgi:hypothetical protein
MLKLEGAKESSFFFLVDETPPISSLDCQAGEKGRSAGAADIP